MKTTTCTAIGIPCTGSPLKNSSVAANARARPAMSAASSDPPHKPAPPQARGAGVAVQDRPPEAAAQRRRLGRHLGHAALAEQPRSPRQPLSAASLCSVQTAAEPLIFSLSLRPRVIADPPSLRSGLSGRKATFSSVSPRDFQKTANAAISLQNYHLRPLSQLGGRAAGVPPALRPASAASEAVRGRGAGRPRRRSSSGRGDPRSRAR